jgi:DNA-directed RNA polymerase subunit L
MQYIEIDDNQCSFYLNNNSSAIKISMANAIRRTIITSIPTYIIHPEETTFFENNSVFNNEFLKHRLSLIPIISYQDLNYDKIMISCKKKNENEYTENLYVSDFLCKNIETNEIIDNKLIFSHENILFAKLKYNQIISFEGKLIKNNADNKGSFHCPVSKCIYTFEIDKPESEKIMATMTDKEILDFKTQDIQRVYEKNKDGEPNRYKFEIEGIGFYKMKDILNMSIKILIDKLILIQKEFRVKNSKKVILEDADNLDFYNFSIENENETIGNILSTYFLNDENIFYCGYLIEHPLKKNIILRIKLKENNNLENIINHCDKNINLIITILNDISKNI